MAQRDTLLTQKQLAEKMQISVRTVKRWQAERGLPVLRGTRRVRYDWKAVLLWMKREDTSKKGTTDGISDA